jgi:hypothetical protein
MSKTTYRLFACLAVIMIFTTGCEKTIQIDPPLNEVSTAFVFSSDKLATSARSGMFGSLSQTVSQGSGLTIFSSLQADDLVYLANVASIAEFYNDSFSSLSTGQAVFFSDWYSIIYRANSIIEGLQKYSGTSDAIKKQYTAEAQFVRAYCYFNLVNQFGDVPLVLTSDVTISAFQPKETTANIYKQIIVDLTAAKANLLNDYSATANDRIGVNKFVATALLARVYLFTGDYANAENSASEVIASSLYAMTPGATINSALFVKNSPETIWQMPAALVATNLYTTEGATFIMPSYTTTSTLYRLNPNLIAIFPTVAPLDLRRTKWINDVVVSGTTYNIPAKYKNSATITTTTGGELQVVMRLAEQYLIRAEARARIGTNLPGALSDMNVTRVRAGLTASTTTVQHTLLDEIALENRKEFFCEQGFRWFNLKRTGQADAVLGALKPSYKPLAKLLPIPQAAIDANPNLTQTTGY